MVQLTEPVLPWPADRPEAIPDYAAMNPFTLHLAFSVDDIAGEHQRLLDAGATAEGPIATTPAGDLLAFLRDPWGTPLQLVRRKTPLR